MPPVCRNAEPRERHRDLYPGPAAFGLRASADYHEVRRKHRCMTAGENKDLQACQSLSEKQLQMGVNYSQISKRPVF
jgi:hypothetical protein